MLHIGVMSELTETAQARLPHAIAFDLVFWVMVKAEEYKTVAEQHGVLSLSSCCSLPVH